MMKWRSGRDSINHLTHCFVLVYFSDNTIMPPVMARHASASAQEVELYEMLTRKIKQASRRRLVVNGRHVQSHKISNEIVNFSKHPSCR